MPTHMGHDAGQNSATIYQFPVGGRASINAHRTTNLSTQLRSDTAVVVSGSWYHEEAIRESQRGFREAPKPASVVIPLTFPRH